MKLIVTILLAFCVFNAESHQFRHHDGDVSATDLAANQRTVLDYLKDLVEKLVQKAKELIEKVKTAVEDFLQSAKAKIEEIVKAAEERINQIVKEVLDKLAELEQQSEEAKQCVAKYRPEVEASIAKAQDDVKICISDAVDYIKSIKDSLQDQISAIQEQIGQLKNLAKECIDITHPIESARCIIDNGGEIIKSIRIIASKAVETVKVAAERLVSILSDAQNCIDTSIKELSAKQSEIYQKIRQCIAGESH